MRFRLRTPSYIRYIANNKTRYRRSIANIQEHTLETGRYITNLSSRPLTSLEITVLSKGLGFVPSSKTDEQKLRDSVASFERSNRLKHFFRNSTQHPTHPLRKKSTWIPPPASPAIEAYLQRIRAETASIRPTHFKPNLSKAELTALNRLSKDQNLVIKPADKGSGIVVEDRENYIKAGLEHLADTKIYETVQTDPTTQLAEAINTYTSHLYNKGIIDHTTKEHLSFPTTNMPRTQQLYFLKKIHKFPIAVRPDAEAPQKKSHNLWTSTSNPLSQKYAPM